MGTNGNNDIMVNNIINNNKHNLSNGGKKLDNTAIHHQHHQHHHHHHHNHHSNQQHNIQQKQSPSNQQNSHQIINTNGKNSSNTMYSLKNSQSLDSNMTGTIHENNLLISREDVDSTATAEVDAISNSGSSNNRINGRIIGLPVAQRGMCMFITCFKIYFFLKIYLQFCRMMEVLCRHHFIFICFPLFYL